MNRKTFLALLTRDAHVARRNFLPLLLQTLLQPMLLVFVFGRVLTTSGMMPETYKSMLLPGIELTNSRENYVLYRNLRMAIFEKTSWKLLEE